MIKKTLTWTDFADETQTEDFYFHVSKMELVELEVSQKEGLSVLLPKMLSEKDMGKVVAIFKKIVRMSLGIRSADGRKFDKISDKAKEYVDEFMSGPAYDALFTDLTSNPHAAEEFVLGIMPKGMPEEMAKATPNSQTPAELPWTRREPTAKELREMSADQLREVYARKTGTPSQE